MSDKKVPKLATKYEKVDPSYQSSSSSSEIPPRVQPTRSAIAQTEEQNLDSIESDYSDTVQSPICLSDESPDSSNVENHSDNPTNINQNISFSPSQTIQNEGIMLNEQQELITGIVTGVLQAMKPSKPKVSPPMLTNTNYTDWSIKMFYAMSLNGLWIDPTKDLERQSTSEKLKNTDALMYLASQLDTTTSAFVNQSSKCFVTVWNEIKRFYEPKTATVLADVHIKIQSIKHSAGQPIEKHLMLMEHQFSRLNDLRKPLDEAHYAALILASIKESGEFSHIFHSAMWGDEDSLTITKLKSALISSQHHTKQSPDEQAHKSFASRPSNKYPHQKSQHSVKAHNRKPRNPDKGWNCSFCQMDNHSYENCFKRKPSNSQQSFNNKTLTKKFSNFSDTPNIPQAEESASYAIAHASRHNSQYSHVSPRHSPYTAQCPSIRHRLGPMPSCPDETSYQSARSYSCDILNAEFVPSFESDDEQDCVYVPSRECHDDSNLLNTYTGKLIKYHRSTLNLNNKFSFLQTRLNQDSRASINRTKQQSSSEIDLSYSEISMNKQVNFNPVNCYFKNLILYSAMPSMNYLANHSKIKNKIIKNTLNSETESVWIIDSGATLNICNSKAYLKEFKPSSGHNVIISDGTPVPIEGYGKLNIKIFMNKSEERFKSLTLNNIAYVPSFDVNLISVRALTLSGLSLKFDQIGCSIDDGNITIPFGYVSNSCYLLNIKHSQTKGPMAMTCIHEIHRKLGHRNIKHILKVKDNLKLKFAKCNCSQECFGCLKGKFHSIPFPQKAVKPTNPRDIITTDVCGPFNTQSLGGARYFVTFTCAHSDYTEVAAIKHKSDCKAELMNYITRLITQFGHPPKIIRSDRGGEYIDSELQSFLCSKGIIFQCTVPRCPQQNGISERKNRTLLEGCT